MVLAAGGGRRLGGPKALLSYRGTPLVDRAIEAARGGGCAPIVVVLGAAADAVRARARLDGVTVLENPAWTTGMGSSLRAGLAALADTGAFAAVVLLVDMPGITSDAVRRVAALPYPNALVCATYHGRRGHPMLLGRDHWPGITTLAAADVGARPYLVARSAQVQGIVCDDVADDSDIDTPEEAARWGIELSR
ncbi:MAG TPA: nucleotidyltransferase family protein [Micromonosporaceae bacterium]|nr:nucleotidyltransferase family protein [Micromonosporaceae bacterium]